MSFTQWSIMDFQDNIRSISEKAKIEIPPDNLYYNIASNLLLVSPEAKKDLINFAFVTKSEEVNGFLNFKMDKNLLKNIAYRKIKGKINLEFCSPNPTGPMHLAHFRGTVVGNTLVNLLRFSGKEILSEMYLNDQGVQLDKFVESIKYWKYGQNYQLHYKGEYVKELADKLEIINKETATNVQLDSILNTLNKMDIKHDLIVKESSLHLIIEQVRAILEEKNLLYRGYLQNQKQEGEHLLLKSSQLGYESDTVFQREDKHYTYFAFDVAYHFYKKMRGYKEQICVLGEDHFSHMKKLPKVLNIFDIDLKFVTFSAVHLIEEKEKISMSKRDGKFITIDEFLKKCSSDEVACMMLEQKLEKTIQFHENKKTNNLFYFQYAFERLKDFNEPSEEVDLNALDSLIEERIFTFLVHFDRFIHIAVSNLNVHKIFDFSLKFVQCLCEYFQKDKTINNNPSVAQVYLLSKSKEVLRDIIYIFNLHL